MSNPLRNFADLLAKFRAWCAKVERDHFKALAILHYRMHSCAHSLVRGVDQRPSGKIERNHTGKQLVEV